MLLSATSIEKLTNIITGFAGLTEKIRKTDIDEILEHSGNLSIVCTYDKCFEEHPDIINNPLYNSREFQQEKYVKLQLEKLNGTSQIHKLIITYFNNIGNYTEEPEEVVEYLNRYFDKDGYSVEKIEETEEYKIYSIDDCLIDYDCLFNESERGNYILINEHNKKCFEKIKTGDYTGAITNSRSLLEQLLCEIKGETQVSQGQRRSGYNGEIDTLIDSVFPMLKISDDLTGAPKSAYLKLEDSFKGLIKGLAILRIGMSDAHAITYIPTQKDAILAVNTAKTLANFIVQHYFEKFVNAA